MSIKQSRTEVPAIKVANRRGFLKTSALGLSAGSLLSAGIASASETAPGAQQPPELSVARSFRTDHELKPLPYKTSALNGLSSRLIESHWSNNYGGSVRALNATNKKLAESLVAKDVPAFVYNGLKREHLMRTGSVILHELYFDNMGGNGRADATVRSDIARGFGDFSTWETEFRRIAAGLGGGSGWVVFGYNIHFQTFENYWLADHLHYPASTVPLLVLDMYEHSYHMDYGSAAAKYVDAFFNNINWNEVSRRIEGIMGSE